MNAKKQIRQAFRDACFKRDGNKCRTCGNPEGITAHHITDRNEIVNGGYCAENGITLCEKCHLKAENYYDSNKANTEVFYPNELYTMIGSSYEKAKKASERIKS